MSERGPSFEEIKALLQASIESLARTLAPAGHRNGKWWVACNPTRDDVKPSFGIGLTGVPGAWVDFATGDKGDVFDLIAYVNGLPPMKTDVKPTLDWARSFLGINGAAPAVVASRIKTAKADAEKRAREAAERAVKNARRAKAFYLDAKKAQFDLTPAALYLAGRGLDVRRLSRMPGCLGYLPEMWHSETNTKWPVMIAGFSNDAGETIAVHRTYLAVASDTPSASRPDATDFAARSRLAAGCAERSRQAQWQKAPVSPQRKIWPSYEGAAIRLWRGESGLSIEAAAKQGLRETLVLVEGVEDGLSVALSDPQYRVWCAGSLSNIANIRIPECVDEVIVCADNDWGKKQAQALLNRGVEALISQSKAVRVARSNRGKDMNDALVA